MVDGRNWVIVYLVWVVLVNLVWEMCGGDDWISMCWCLIIGCVMG